jgi:hypothetical protein
MKLPKPTVRQIVINDTHNRHKTHVFRIYLCGHIRYNQAINGQFFYSSFKPTNREHGYRNYLS